MKSILHQLVSRLSSLFQKNDSETPTDNGLGSMPGLLKRIKESYVLFIGTLPVSMKNRFAVSFSSIMLVLLFTTQGWAQLSIPTAGTAVTQNFDIGTSATATVPTGFKICTGASPDWATGTTATTAAAGTSGTGALTGTSAGGVYNFANGATASATDRSVGFLTTGSFASPNSIILKFTNNTGITVNNLSISFDYEKYRAGTRAWNMTFFHGTATNPTTSEPTGDQAYGVDAANGVVNPPTTISKTISITGLSIANGTSYYLKWTSTGLAGPTNSQGIGIDNFSITASSASTPTISTTGTLVAVNTTYGTASAETSFNVSGANITGGILVTPPAGYEVSLTSGGSFTSTVTVGSSGTISSTPVYVRLMATATFAGSPYSGNIVCSSSGASNVNVATVSSAVSKKTVTITGASASNKIYDRTTTATITGATPNGIVNSDPITVSGGGTFSDFNVGTAKPVTATLVLNGTNATSYLITQPTGLTADITAKDVSISGVSANNKVYDGNTNATLSGTLTGVISPDDTTVILTASFDSPFVDVSIPVTSSSYLSGTSIGNYNLIQPTGLTADITPKALTIAGATAQNKVYDGNTDALITGTLSGVVAPDSVTLVGTGTFASAAVGTNIAVTSTSTIEGDISNYTLTQPTGLTANISAAALLPQTITFDPLADVVYGSADFYLTATTDASLEVSYASSDPTVATIVAGASPGTYKVHVVKVGSTTITATQSGDAIYDSATPVDQVLNVTPKELTVTESAANKVYDGTDIAVVTGTLNGVVGSDDVTFIGSGNFASTAVGTAIDVYPNSTLGGADAGNYTLLEDVLSADITPLDLTTTGATASNKVYDGNTTATITGATLQGVIAPDVVTVSGGGVFASSIVANGIAVTTSLILGGADAGNYTLTQPSGLTANITPLGLTISGLSGTDRVYDRTTVATLSGSLTLNGIIGTDDVSATGTPTVTFANKTVGNAKAITVTGYTLTGAQAGNYTVAQPTGLTANVTPFSLTIFGAAATSKIFDGTTAAVITGTLIGSLGADVVTLIGTGTFASSAVGTNIAVTSTSTIGGADGGNYIINPQPTGLTANIASAPTTLASQDFEVVPATPTLTFTTSDVATPGASSGFTTGQTGSSTVDAPATTNLFAGGARGYRFQGPSSGTASRTLTFAAVDASAYTNIQASFRVAGMSLGSNANGIDAATGTTILGALTPVDFALIEVSPDGGTTWYKQGVVNVSGTNVRWSFAPTGSGSKVYAANDSYSNFTTTGTGTITSGTTAITTATITSLPSVAALQIRITLETNSANESWIIDDVNITGIAGSACTTPDSLTALTASNGSSLSVVNWTYGSCYDEALVVASTSAFTSATPTGDGTAYTVNSQSFTDGLNTSFDGGKVVYRGPLGSATITSLTNGTLYNFKVFVRKGTNWTSGDITSATPVEAQYFWDADGATTAATGGTGTWDSAATSNWRTPNDTGTLAPWVTNTAPLNATLAGTAGTITVSTGLANTAPNLYINTTGYTLAVAGTTAATLPAVNTVLGNNVSVTVAANVNTVTPASGTLNVGSISGTGTAGITIPSAQNILGVAQRINLSRASSSIGVPITITSAGGTGTAAIAQIVATATGTSLSSAATITNNTAIKTGLGATSGFDLTANGIISGSADLIFAASPSGGAGTVILGAANTYTGATLFNAATGGIVKLGTTNALPTATNVTMALSSGTGGILDLNGFNQTIGSLTNGLGGGSIRNNATATDATLTLNGTTSTTFSLPITDGTSKVALTKAGSSTLTLSSTANTYTGGTTISGGAIQLGAAGVLANAGAIVLNGGSLNTAGFSETVGTLNLNSTGTLALGSGNHSLIFANSSAVSWAGTTLTVSGWLGTAGATGTDGKLFVGTTAAGLTAGQLAKITFTGYTGNAIQLSTGEVVPSGPSLAVTLGSLDHGATCIGSAASFVDYTITNTGAAAASVSVVSDNAEFVVSNAPTSIDAASTATYRVTFTPSASGLRTATITISTTTPNSNSPVLSSVTGTGNTVVTWYADADGDTYGNAAVSQLSCTQPVGYVANNTDCDDTNVSIYQFASFYVDADADGYDFGTASVCSGLTAPTGYSATTNGSDCDDANVNIYQFATFYVDADADGYDFGTASVCSGLTAPTGYSATTNGTDCNDADATKHDSFPFYVDGDGDGYGAGSAVSVCAVNATTAPSGYSVTNDDCNDADPLLNPTNPCSAGSIVNLTLFVQDYYIGSGTMNSVKNNQDYVSPTTDVEDLVVELHDAATYALVDTAIGTLHTDGTLQATFNTAAAGSYYIAVKGSNMVQTWTAEPQTVGTTPLTFDFTTSASQAYEDNMVEVEAGVFAFYSGDINQDEAVDNSDTTDLENDISNSNYGVLATDLNGDGAVDNSDTNSIYTNIDNSIYSHHPF